MVKRLKYETAYIFSEVNSNDNIFLLPFDGRGIPMEYNDLQELLKSLNSALESITEEDYVNFYNQCLQNFYEEIEFSNEINKSISYTNRSKEKENYIKRFDTNIMKPILDEDEIKKYLNNMISFPESYINTENIKYPILIHFYENNTLLKVIKCTNNLLKTLQKIKDKCKYNKYSYTYIPENYIDQILEYCILFKNPTMTSVLSIKNHIIYNTLIAIQKRINYEGDYIIKKNTINKIIKNNNIVCFEKDGKIFTNARITLEKIGDYISGVKRKDLK